MNDFSQHKLIALPFAVATPTHVNLWPAAAGPVDDHISQGREGRDRAAQAIDYMQANDAPMLLGHVMNAISKQGHWGALEVGFCHGIAATLMGAGMGRGQNDIDTTPAIPALRLIVDND